jgi:WD40 repeat protein
MTSNHEPWGALGASEMDIDTEPKLETPPTTEESGAVTQEGQLVSIHENIHTESDHPISQRTLQDRLAHLDLSLHSIAERQRYAIPSDSPSRRLSLALSQHVEPTPAASGVHLIHNDGIYQESVDGLQMPLVQSQIPLDEQNANIVEASDSIVASPAQSQSSTPSREQQPCRPNPDSNHDICTFLRAWRLAFDDKNISEPINQEVFSMRGWERPSIISRAEIENLDADIQGINWSRLGATRDGGRRVRSLYHQQLKAWSRHTSPSATKLADTEQLFNFRQTNLEHRAWIEHYQLRNLIVSTSQSDMYYVSKSKIMHTGPSTLQASCTMDLTEPDTVSVQSGGFRVTALAAAENVLIAGGFRGEYALQSLSSEYGTNPVKSHVSRNAAAMTNHIHTFTSRIHGFPQAVFCSNDKHVRVLDCNTNTFVNEVQYGDYVNCAATSPNGRLRVLVGDFEGSLVVDADSGRQLERLGGHTDDAFACTWADDNIHVATAAQDSHVLVWDARNWSQPLADIACEMTHATSLRFSPVGGGKRVLVAAEAADVVNIIDADTFDRKQVLRCFGDIGGTYISSDGSQLTVANSDSTFGGLITYQRASFKDIGDSDDDEVFASTASDFGPPARNRRGKAYQWLPEYELDLDPRVRLTAKARSRRGLGLDDISF